VGEEDDGLPRTGLGTRSPSVDRRCFTRRSDRMSFPCRYFCISSSVTYVPHQPPSWLGSISAGAVAVLEKWGPVIAMKERRCRRSRKAVARGSSKEAKTQRATGVGRRRSKGEAIPGAPIYRGRATVPPTLPYATWHKNCSTTPTTLRCRIVCAEGNSTEDHTGVTVKAMRAHDPR